MRNYFLIVIFLVCALYLAGCSISLSCYIYNNTGNDIVVSRILYGSNVDIDIEAGSSALIKDWSSATINVFGDHVRWSFTPIIPIDQTERFVDYRGIGPWSTRFIKVQLEKDGRIFILEPSKIAPVVGFPEQPNGFPMYPKIS